MKKPMLTTSRMIFLSAILLFSAIEISCTKTTTSSVTCGTPSGLSAAPSAKKATLSWSTVSGATSYNIQYKLSTGTTWTTVTSATNSVILTGLTISTAYNYQVQAVCTTAGAYSTMSSFTTLTPSVVGFWKGQYSNAGPGTAPNLNYEFELFRNDGTLREAFSPTDTTTTNKTDGTYTISGFNVNWTTTYLGTYIFDYTAVLSDNGDTLTGTWGADPSNTSYGELLLIRQ